MLRGTSASMLKVWVTVAVLGALVGAVPMDDEWGDKKIADQDYLMKQKSIMQLLSHVHQPMFMPEMKQIAMTYRIEENMDNYKCQEPIMEYLKFWEDGMLLKKEEIFTPLDDWHFRQSMYLMDMFMSAKNWDTFYKTAVWARYHMNHDLFLFSFTSALRQHSITKTHIIPPLYDITPHMFVRDEVIEKAYETRMRTTDKMDKEIRIIHSNFSNWMHPKMNPEHRLNYFTEDVSMNDYHMDWYREFAPYFLIGDDGKYYLDYDKHFVPQLYDSMRLLARYNLERLANNLPETMKFNWDKTQMLGHAPHLRYKNGKEMPMRPENMEIRSTDDVDIETLKRMENMLLNKIDTMSKSESFDSLPKELKNEFSREYMSIWRKYLTLIGRAVDPMSHHGLAPSAIMHWQTMLRDPMFYQVTQRLHEYHMKMTSKDVPYMKEDLQFKGVEIEDVDFDKLITFFEPFEVELNNAVDVGNMDEEKKVNILARHIRLNHKIFNYRIMVKSEKPTTAMVRVFIGPKYDVNGMEMSLKDKTRSTYELDRFVMELKSGSSKIERSSMQTPLFKSDKMSFKTLIKKIEDGIHDKAEFTIDEQKMSPRFPCHLLLPKGKKNGMPYSMMVMVSTLPKNKIALEKGKIMWDDKPMGFPFDRPIIDSEFKIPNFIEKEVYIYHKKTDETFETI